MIRIRFHITALLLPILPFSGLLSTAQTVILWTSALLHEGGHLLATHLCGGRFDSITVLPFGLAATPSNPLRLTPKDEIFCALFGPAVNLTVSALILALPSVLLSETVLYTLYCNLCLLTVNLLPILPLDGGRALYFALALRKNPHFCETFCRRCGWIVLGLLLFPACIFFFQDRNPSLLLIWGYLGGYHILRRGSI